MNSALSEAGDMAAILHLFCHFCPCRRGDRIHAWLSRWPQLLSARITSKRKNHEIKNTKTPSSKLRAQYQYPKAGAELLLEMRNSLTRGLKASDISRPESSLYLHTTISLERVGRERKVGVWYSANRKKKAEHNKWYPLAPLKPWVYSSISRSRPLDAFCPRLPQLGVYFVEERFLEFQKVGGWSMISYEYSENLPIQWEAVLMVPCNLGPAVEPSQIRRPKREEARSVGGSIHE